MGRKSLAQLYYEEYEEREASREEGHWMVIYDFPQMKPQAGFWRNIHRLRVISGAGVLVQYSAFLTTDRNAALTILRLVQHYDGEVMAYKLGEEIMIGPLVRPDRGLRGYTFHLYCVQSFPDG